MYDFHSFLSFDYMQMSIKKILGVSNEMSMTDVKYLDVWMLLWLVPKAIDQLFFDMPDIFVVWGIILFLYFLTLWFICSLVRRTFKEMKFTTNVTIDKAVLVEREVWKYLSDKENKDDKETSLPEA